MCAKTNTNTNDGETLVKNKYKASVALGRKISIYPPQKYKDLIEAECKLDGKNLKKSEVIVKIISDYYNGLPDKQIERLRRVSKNSF